MSSFQEGNGAAPFAVVTHGQQWNSTGAPSGRRASTMASPISPFSDGSQQPDAWALSPDSSNDSRHGSSPEEDSLVSPSPSRSSRSGRTPSRYDWSKYMPIIKKLYIDEDKTLKEVLETMQREYDFVATPRMVKTRLKKWGYSKNVSIKSEEVESLMEMIFDAESQGDVRRTSTEVTLATGRVVGLDRVAAHLRRKRIPANIVQKASQLSMARYHNGGSPPSPTSLQSPIELRLPESIFSDVHSYVYGTYQLPDATTIVRSGPRKTGGIAGVGSSVRKFFEIHKDTEALVLLRKLPDRFKDLLDSGDADIPRLVFFTLIQLLKAPEGQRLNATIKSLVKYVASLASGETSPWPPHHPLRRILVSLGEATDADLLEVVIRGYKCLLLSWESLPTELVGRYHTTPAWLDLGESAGFDSLPVAHLEKSLQEAYELSLISQEEGQPQPYQHLFWMAELERQKTKALGMPTDRLKELYSMALQASQGMDDQSGLNAQLNCHYYVAGLYHNEGNRSAAVHHMTEAIKVTRKSGIDTMNITLTGELQEWHRGWGNTDEAAAIGEDLASKMDSLSLEPSSG